MAQPPPHPSPSLSDVPDDELVAYAAALGLTADTQTPRGELLRVIRDRQELLLDIDHDALLDIVMWARVPVRKSASKEELARQIAAITKLRFDGLSDKGLRAMARLDGIDVQQADARKSIEKRLRGRRGLAARLRQRRRALVGSMLARFVERHDGASDYRFLPEDDANTGLKERIEDAGVVAGIAQKIRGAADSYVEQKLDDIERRIDRKLDEIDGRLGEWRDREVANRLRLVKITLITAIVVAVISLGYHYVKSRALSTEQPNARSVPVDLDENVERTPS